MNNRIILVKAGPTNTDDWVDNLKPLLNGFEIKRWDGLYDPESVEYVIGWMPNALWANQFPNLKALISIGSGVDHIKHLKDFRSDVPIIRTVSDDLIQRMKEFVVASILYWHRRLPEMAKNQRNAKWVKYTAPIASELKIGVLGFGSMGQSASAALANIGYQVSVWANSPRSNVNFDYYFGNDQLASFGKDLDAVICMLPNTPSTQGILSSSLFDFMKDGACVINVGRGVHLNEPDLIRSIEAGRIETAVLDVFDKEPLPEDSPLWTIPNILISSHSAAYISPDAGPKIIASNIVKFDSGGEVGPIYDPQKGY